jgi:acyl-CoA reductase-like NAD-dependent aldehyde dehydrogenase
MATTEIALERYDLWIGGEQRESRSGATFTRVSPYNGDLVSEYANADEKDAEEAIAIARRTFDSGTWATASARERHGVLRRTAELLEDNAPFIAERVALEAGKPVNLTLGEVGTSARALEFFAGAVLADEGSAISHRVPDALGLVLREPVGVVSMITAWNFPVAQVAQKAGAALAAGCTVVLKPSHFCAAPALLLAEYLHEAGLPPGVFNVVPSDRDRGALVGQYLAGSADVDMVGLTGSTAAGRAVMRAAASNIKRIALELGGKSANIVFDDAPFDVAARTAVSAFTTISGQQCSAGSRLLVQRGIHKRLVAALKQHVAEHVLGDPCEAGTTMGPLINSDQLERVLGYIEMGRSVGDLVAGGGQPKIDRSHNLFVEPTIFDNVSNTSRLAQDEVFGPVLAVIPFDTEEEAIALANDSEYGLAGGLWTTSIDRAIRVTKAVRTGKFFVNSYNTAGIDDMPHGGYKNSGIGREFGLPGIHEFQELKTVQIKIAEDAP